MSEVKTAPQEVKKPVFQFGKKERALITDPISDNNPITVQVLGICSALAVTTLVSKAVVMAIAVVFVITSANVLTSALRRYIPKQVRMIVQLVIIASLVTIVELTLKAIHFPIYKELSVFIGLIITNCIIMGRLEAFAMGNDTYRSALDGLGNGIGYGIILIIVAVVREFFGKGSIMDIMIFGPGAEYMINTSEISWLSWYTHNNLMVLFPSAMIVIGVLIWMHRAWRPNLVDVS
ncbi:MAG TPA: NADH:ubiquinone reductase (Na(+)-transporting) subunit D [Saprospiraceae bacterium]|nr:NADH:ubiquinone reductase (Na(+)-transporting) subunit D [Saprospiraceae bacterium]